MGTRELLRRIGQWCVVSGAVGAFALAGCGDEGIEGAVVDRWEGEGCQPACIYHASEGQPRMRCLPPSGGPEACIEEGTPNVACTTGLPTCNTEDGLPRCLQQPESRQKPLCVP